MVAAVACLPDKPDKADMEKGKREENEWAGDQGESIPKICPIYLNE